MEFRDGDLWLEFDESDNDLPIRLTINGISHSKPLSFINRLKKIIKAYDDYYDRSFSNEVVEQIFQTRLKNEGKIEGILDAIRCFRGELNANRN